LFVPDRRNWWHQKFCSKPDCRKASKAESQRRWLSKPGNWDVVRGSANVERVRQWRAKNPGYWKRPAKTSRTLQEVVPAQAPDRQQLTETTSSPPLQDFVALQDPLVVGLIAHLVDSPLQEVVEQAALRLLQKGRNILDMRSRMKSKGNTDANQETSAVPSPASQGSPAVQCVASVSVRCPKNFAGNAISGCPLRSGGRRYRRGEFSAPAAPVELPIAVP
jgi:hypothetical protein